jgi:hypothetical protein
MPPKEKPVDHSQQETQQVEDDKKKPVVGKRQKIVKACKDCRRRKVSTSHRKLDLY